MAGNGVRISDFSAAAAADALIGLRNGSGMQIPIELLIQIVLGRIGPTYATLAEIQADLSWGAGSVGAVWGDPDDSNQGTYLKTGAAGAGSWDRIGDLPINAPTAAILAGKADTSALTTESLARAAAISGLQEQVAALATGLTPKGSWAASGSFPADSLRGDFWVVSTPGEVDGQSFAVGDWLIALIDAPSVTTFEENWARADYSKTAPRSFPDWNDLISAADVWAGQLVTVQNGIGGGPEQIVILPGTTYADPDESLVRTLTASGLQGESTRRIYRSQSEREADPRTLANGLDVLVQTVLGAAFTVVPTGYSGPDKLVIPGSGANAFSIVTNRSTVYAEALGIDHGDVSDPSVQLLNRQKIEAASAWLAATYGKHEIRFGPEGVVNFDQKARLYDGAIIDGAGSLLRSVVTAPSLPDAGGVFAIGSFHPYDVDDQTWDALQAVTQGDQGVTLAVAGRGTAYQVGDTVWIAESTGTFGYTSGSGAIPMPLSWQWDVVDEISGDLIYLRYGARNTIGAGSGTIAVNATGAWIANVSRRVAVGSKTTGVWTPRHVARDVALLRTRLENSCGQSVFGRMGCVNFQMDDFEIQPSWHPMPFNALSHANIRNGRVHGFGNRLLEITSGSHNLLIESIIAAKGRAAPGYDPTADNADESEINIGEMSSDVVLRDLVADTGRHGALCAYTGTHSAPTALNIANCDRVVLDNVQLRGNGVHTQSVGIASTCRDSTIRGGRIDIGSVPVHFSHSGIRTALDGVTFVGAATSLVGSTPRLGFIRAAAVDGSLSDNTFRTEGLVDLESGAAGMRVRGNRGILTFNGSTVVPALDVSGNSSSTSRAIRLAMAPIAAVSTQSTSAVTLAAASIPAGNLQSRDVTEWMIEGAITGTADTKNLTLTLTGAIAATLFNWTLAATTTKWSLQLRIIWTAGTTATLAARLMENNAYTQQAISAPSGLTPATNALGITLTGYVANAADTLKTLAVMQQTLRDGWALR